MAEGQSEIYDPGAGDGRLASETGILQGGVKKLPGKEAFENMAAKTGIVFFHDDWGPNEQGDPIDLCSGSRRTDWTSWIRIQAGIYLPGAWSDYRNAKSVWF